MSFCTNAFAQNNNEAIKDASYIIEILSAVDDTPLYILSQSPPYGEINFVSEKCMLTNAGIENMIRLHAMRFEGGQSRRAIARALDRLMSVFAKSMGITHNGQTPEEQKLLKLVVMKNSSLFALFCFSSEYRDVPRN